MLCVEQWLSLLVCDQLAGFAITVSHWLLCVVFRCAICEVERLASSPTTHYLPRSLRPPLTPTQAGKSAYHSKRYTPSTIVVL